MPNTAGAGHPAKSYVEAVGSDEPVPGGGSVAATVGALAAALAEMVSRFTAGRSDDRAINERIDLILAEMTGARTRLLDLAIEDEAAFGAYGEASALTRSSSEERVARTAALQKALVGAAQVPLQTAQVCRALDDAIAFLLEHGTPHLRSDAEIARILMTAAIQASAVNVRANTVLIKDREVAAALDRRIDQLVG